MSNGEPWKGFEQRLDGHEKLFEYFEKEGFERWIFRGQYSKWELKTSLERACENSGLLGEEDHRKIEGSMIRQFKRVYDGNDRDRVQNDTLYLLSLMRHHGAPTRLLDFTYSKYVGIYFALEYANDNKPIRGKKCCAVWCINTEWLTDAAKRAKRITPGIEKLIDERVRDETRNDSSFKPLYIDNRFTFVGWENPFGLHQRLHLQQGIFLCPGNITKTFMENVKEFKGWESEGSMRKIVCRMGTDDLHKALDRCRRMNISRESLFPGLDGFAQSMTYQLYSYRNLFDYMMPPGMSDVLPNSR